MYQTLQVEYRELAEEYARAIKELFENRLVSICFFGSVAKGTATVESDIDVLVVAENLPRDIGFRMRETIPIHERVRSSEPYRKVRSEGRSAFLSPVLLTPDETKTHPPILLDLTEDAVMVYDRDQFLRNTLDDMRRRLKQLGARKVTARKGYYWILKPDAKPNEVVEI